MILTINCGSSTIKYQLFANDVAQFMAKGIVSRIGEDGSYIQHRANGHEIRREIPIKNHHEAFELCIQYLLHPDHGAIRDVAAIEAVGHRAVHGADRFVASTLITPEMIAKMEECVPLAPLHNPPNLIGIREAQAMLPAVPHVAVFDTAFHQTMPPEAYMYALPYAMYEEHHIRKYGFHGTSCRYVSERAAAMCNRPQTELKSVICHLGNGVTITAVDGGKSVDTSIGFATFSGVMMGTRSGDIDPGLIFYSHNELGLSLAEIQDILYNKSGFLGVSGVSNDMRTITQEAASGNTRCQLAMEMFAYMVRKYIGAYAAAMGGIDCLIFTAGIGENSSIIRHMVCESLSFLGITLDEERNEAAVGGAAERIISKSGERVDVLVVPTNEERMIALDTQRLAHLAPLPA